MAAAHFCIYLVVAHEMLDRLIQRFAVPAHPMRTVPYRQEIARRNIPAFSLIELLMVIAIIGILLAVAASVMSPNESRGRLVARDMIVASLNQARSHAISTGTPTAVVIAPSDPGLGAESGRILGLVEVSRTDKSTKLLSRWKELPKGQIFMPQALAGLTRPTILEDPERLVVGYRRDQGQTLELSMPYVLFGSEGAVIYPVGKKIEIAVSPGIAKRNGQFQLTGRNRGKETAVIIEVSPLSGKARIMSPSRN